MDNAECYRMLEELREMFSDREILEHYFGWLTTDQNVKILEDFKTDHDL